MMNWINRIKETEWFRKIFYFFPVQLVFVHLKNNQILVLTWLILMGFITQSLAPKYGVPILFLSPEYLGSVSLISFFIIGFSFGGFIMAFNISSYIMNGHRFPFIATISRPFIKYCINNIFWSGSLVLVYLCCFIRFQLREGVDLLEIAQYLVGFLSGLFFLLWINFVYFKTTNKDLSKVSKGKYKTDQEGKNPIRAVLHKRVKWNNFFNPDREWTIETYLSGIKKIALARPTDHYDKDMLKQVFEQNHLNAAMFEIIVLISILSLSFGSDIEFFMIPAGASLTLMFTMFVMITSAIHSWFRGWAPAVMIILFLGFNYVSQFEFFNPPNKAYGLNYETQPAKFTQDVLNHNINPENFQKDFAHTIQILENWRKKNLHQTTVSRKKPKMVFINTTGGGMRSSLWSFYAIQHIDSILGGELMHHTQLITGSSGGLIGMAYLREMYNLKQKGECDNFHSRELALNMSKDILNRLGFAWTVNDLVFKFQSFEDGNYTYKKDRGYAFEQQLNANTNNVLNKRLYEYYQPEFKAEIPMLIINPTIVNDGRRLIISPQPTSYLSYVGPQGNVKNNFLLESIEFKRFFEYQDARNLQFTTALRMSSTFPYVMPIVHLPSEPVIEVMDAGIRDNFGIKNSIKFLYTFRNWIATNTSGVIFIQIRDQYKHHPIQENPNKTILKALSSPLGTVIKNLFVTQDYDHDQLIQYTSEWFNGRVDVIDLVLDNSEEKKLSLSWHLTEMEKKQIFGSIHRPDNQASIHQLIQLLE